MLIADLLERIATHGPTGLADAVSGTLTSLLGAAEVAIHLVTYEETELVPVGSIESARRRRPVAVAGTEAGRAYIGGVGVTDAAHPCTRWEPITYAGERLGVLFVRLPEGGVIDADLAAVLRGVAPAVAQALAAARPLRDDLELARRSQEMASAAELLQAVLPPAALTTARFSLAALVEPVYSAGGDAYDHAVDADVLHLGVLDAMGHGYGAAHASTVAITAYRSHRRQGFHLPENVRATDALLDTQGLGGRFVTAWFAEFDVATGRIEWVSAGHPGALVVALDGGVRTLEVEPVPPLGTGLVLTDPDVGVDYLEPGDLLVAFTDGLTEARGLDGDLLGVDGLADVLATAAREQRTATEIVRRVRADLLAREDAWLNDDATAVFVRWNGPPV